MKVARRWGVLIEVLMACTPRTVRKKIKMFNSARSSGFAPLLSPLINLNEGNRMNDRSHSGPESLSTAGQRIKLIINKSIRHKIKHFALHLLSEPLNPPPSLPLSFSPAGWSGRALRGVLLQWDSHGSWHVAVPLHSILTCAGLCRIEWSAGGSFLLLLQPSDTAHLTLPC